MAQTQDTNAPGAPSLLRRFVLACLAIMVISAVIVFAILFSSSNGFDRGLMVFSYLTVPSQDLIRPAFDAMLPADIDGPEAGVALILFSAWLQASVITASIAALACVLFVVFRATGRQPT